jgi:hydroxyacylglutathione hydrolase
MQINEKNTTSVAYAKVNPFEENTYVLFDGSGECVIIDPGCYTQGEQKWLTQFISSRKLTPVRCLLTHAHLDHVFGCAFVHHTYGLLPELHRGELMVYDYAPISAQKYGVPMEALPAPDRFLLPDTTLTFGNSTLQLLFVPGHSPAHLCFYVASDDFVIAGDTLFAGSIGRTDLPGGNHNALITNIKTQLFTLPDKTVVYSGHGGSTTIGREKQYNPFFV